MDKEILKQYDALKDEQQHIRKEIRKLEREMDEILGTVVSDTVMGTREDGTYGPIKIKGIPFPEYDLRREKLQRRLARYEGINTQLTGMIEEIESFISEVDEPRIRTILRLRYIDGRTWREIGRRYGKAPSWAFQKVELFFKKRLQCEKIERLNENGK